MVNGNLQRPMDRSLEKQKAESIRHTMQTQEDVFKQQVRIYILTHAYVAHIYGFDYSILFRVQFWFRTSDFSFLLK